MNRNWMRPPDSQVLTAFIEDRVTCTYQLTSDAQTGFCDHTSQFCTRLSQERAEHQFAGTKQRKVRTAVLRLQNDTCTCAESAQQRAAVVYNAGKQHQLPCVH